MNDLSTRLAQLGEILSGELQQRLSDWSQPGGALDMPVAGLTPLVRTGEDVERWQTGLSIWTQLEDQFSGGFIPSNLLHSSEADTAETSPPEALPEDRFQDRTASHRGSSASRNTGTLPERPAGYDPFGPERIPSPKAMDPWTPEQPESAQARSSLGTPAAPNLRPPAEFLGSPDTEKTSGDMVPPGNTPPNPEQPNKPKDAAKTLERPRMPVSLPGSTAEQDAARREPPASIWSQPLQGLGDFMTNYVPPPAPVWTPPEMPEPPKALPVFVPPSFSPEVTPPVDTPLPGAMPRNGAAISPPGNPSVSGTAAETHTGAFPENQAFQSIEPTENTSLTIPDTDELLDELTQRIIRDFRRFYP